MERIPTWEAVHGSSSTPYSRPGVCKGQIRTSKKFPGLEDVSLRNKQCRKMQHVFRGCNVSECVQQIHRKPLPDSDHVSGTSSIVRELSGALPKRGAGTRKHSSCHRPHRFRFTTSRSHSLSPQNLITNIKILLRHQLCQQLPREILFSSNTLSRVRNPSSCPYQSYRRRLPWAACVFSPGSSNS